MVKCEDIITKYADWIKKSYNVISGPNECLIITNFVLPNNDCIEVKIVNNKDNIIITDNGHTWEYLFLNGADIDIPSKRRSQIEAIVQKFNLQFSGNEIYGYVDNLDHFYIMFNNILNAIQQASSLVYTAKEIAKLTFREETEKYLKEHGYRIDSNYEIEGYSTKHSFSIAVVKKYINLIEPLSTPSPYYANILAQRTAFKWYDLRMANIKFIGISFFNDEDNVWSNENYKILEKYSDYILAWSERDKITNFIDAA